MQMHSLVFLTVVLFAVPCTACSANQQSTITLTENNGTIFNYESPPVNATCQWIMTASVGKVFRIYLWVLFLAKPSSEDGYLRLYDGSRNTSNLLANALAESKCSDSICYFESYFYSSGRSMLLELKTGQLDFSGIFAEYRAHVKQDCSINNTLVAPKSPTEHNFTSPFYPFGYRRNTTCGWHITAPEDHVVMLQLTIKLPDSSADKDSLEVFDVDGSKLTPIPIPEPNGGKIYSKFRFVYVVFKSNDVVLGDSGKGILVKYSAIKTASSGACILKSNSQVHMAGEGRSFSSPGYPSYPGEGSCTWNITVHPGNFIKLTFWNIKEPCWQNYVMVFDMENFSSVLLGKFCNESKKEVYSQRNNLLVKFSSIRSLQQSGGFYATYESIKEIPAGYSCRSGHITMTETSGEFASNDYPLPYSNDVECSWEIKRPVGSVVQLTFHSFELQQSSDCEADYVAINHIEKFCGTSTPGVIQINDSKVYVEFKTDSSGKYPGFHASYKILLDPNMGPCKYPGQDNIIPLTGDTGKISSPLYPNKFKESITCTWPITVPEGHFVRLRIKSFQFNALCDWSSLKIRDGQNSSSNLLEYFCGWTSKKDVFSSSRYLWVQYSANDRSEDKFYAVFEAVKQLPASFACTAKNKDKYFESDSGTMASYNYPLSYDDSIRCEWSIATDFSHNIELSFDFFHLSDSPDCTEDYVEVRHGLSDTGDLAGKFCGSEKPSSITSEGSHLYVVFKASGKTKYPGFKATYETKKTAYAVFQIVGIVLGGFFLVFIITGCSCKYGRCCKDHNVPQVDQECMEAGIEQGLRDGAESVPPQQEATSKV